MGTFDLSATHLVVWRSVRAVRVCAVEAFTRTCSATGTVPPYWPPSQRLDTVLSHTRPGGLRSFPRCPPIIELHTKISFDLSSSTISAVWDREGGFMCDQQGVVTKEWRWLTGITQTEKVVIPVRPQSCFNAGDIFIISRPRSPSQTRVSPAGV